MQKDIFSTKFIGRVTFLELFIWSTSVFGGFDPQQFPSNESFVTRIGDRIVGYTVTRFEKKGTRLRFYETDALMLRMLGKDQILNMSMWAETNSDIQIESFYYELSASGQRTSVSGRREKNRLVLNVAMNGNDFSKIISPKQPKFWEFLLSPTIAPRLLRLGLETMTRFQGELFEPNSFGFSPLEVTVSRENEAYRTEALYFGQKAISWLAPTGRTLRSTMHLGRLVLEMSPVPEGISEAALKAKMGGPGLDIISSTSILAQGKISNPSASKRLVVELGGIRPSEFTLTTHRQKLVGNRVTIERDQVGEFPKKLTEIDRTVFKKDLAEEPFIQSNDPQIARLSSEIRGSETNAWKVAKKLQKWVFRSLKKEAVISIPDARSVLKEKRGDCNEHTILFVALARAAGIPSKMQLGVVYQGERFFYHAWPAVYVGKWVSIDPTWNQIPADVTHISFEEGGLDNQQKLAGLVGSLQIKVLSVE